MNPNKQKQQQALPKKCNQCLLPFSLQKLPLKMPTCSHNLCEECLQQIKKSKFNEIQCQFCSKIVKGAQGKKFQIDRTLVAKLKKSKEDKTDEDGQQKIEGNGSYGGDGDISANSSTKAQHQILLDNQILLSDQESSGKKQKKIKAQYQICPQHEKPLEIICITDLKMICPHCAIFGNHKDHVFKTLKQFSKDYDQAYQKLQIIKQQKYTYSKKLNVQKQKSTIQSSLSQKKSLIRNEIQKFFQKFTTEIQNLQASICQELNHIYSGIYQNVVNIFEQDNKIQQQYRKWEVECQNLLENVEKSQGFDQRIKILYSSIGRIEGGQELVDKLEKRLQINLKKIENLVSSVSIQAKQNYDFTKLVKIIKKQQDPKKDNFMQMIEKINLPAGNHILEDIDNFNQNSFITDFAKQDFSLILQNQPKRPTKSVMTKRSPPQSIKHIQSNKSPTKMASNPLTRHKSNTNIKFDLQPSISPSISLSQSQLLQNLSDIGPSSSSSQPRDPEPIIHDFLTHDLKQVLDLSRCQLTDELAYKYLKQIRKHRKIRGLKLCQNLITDNGLQKILDFLGSTSNLNLSYNRLTEQSLSILIRNRDKIAPLRIVNLGFNLIGEKERDGVDRRDKARKGKERIQALRKMGVIVNL